MIAEYEELRIRIWKVGAARYVVFANGPASASAIIEIPNPKEFAERRNLLLEEEFRRLPAQREPLAERLKKLGRELFDVLIPVDIYRCLLKSHDYANRHGRK